jgi:hypothetical protein
VTSSPSFGAGASPTSKVLPRPTAASGGSPTAKPASITAPPSQPFVTIQGVTSYDTAAVAAPQQVTVIGGPLSQYTSVPANWITSGTGPIDLKVGL